MTARFEQLLSQRLRPLCEAGERVLVGVSGGADSVALLHGLTAIAEQFPLTLVAAHFNHGVRSSADADQSWVRELCKQVGVPFLTNEIPPSRPAGDLPGEAELREARYAFLTQSALEQNCRVICVAHHADDQAETVLHHLIRGTSLRGLAGIPQNRTLCAGLHLVRPLLQTSRREIEDYLEQLGQGYLEDPTNQEAIYTRNRIRHQLLPLLEEINSGATRHLLELVEQVSEVQQFHEQLVRQALQKALISAESHTARLRVAAILELPDVLQREMLVELWIQQCWPRQKMGSREWRALAELVGTTSGRVNLPGKITAERTGAMLRLTRAQ